MEGASFFTYWGACKESDCLDICVRFVEPAATNMTLSAECGLCGHPRRSHRSKAYRKNGNDEVIWLDSADLHGNARNEASALGRRAVEEPHEEPPRTRRRISSTNGQNGLGRAPPVGQIFRPINSTPNSNTNNNNSSAARSPVPQVSPLMDAISTNHSTNSMGTITSANSPINTNAVPSTPTNSTEEQEATVSILCFPSPLSEVLCALHNFYFCDLWPLSLTPHILLLLFSFSLTGTDGIAKPVSAHVLFRHTHHKCGTAHSGRLDWRTAERASPRAHNIL